MNADRTNRTSCSTLHEVTAEFRAFKEWTKDMFAERDKFGTERAARIDERINAMKEQTTIAFASSEKAVEKSESAQKDYNVRSNEFRQALDDAQKNSVAIGRFEDFKKEYEGYKQSQSSEIRILREAKSTSEGRTAGISAVAAFIIAIVSALGGGGIIGIIFTLMKK